MDRAAQNAPPAQATFVTINDAHANQHARRQAEQMETALAGDLKIADVTPAMQEEFRRQQPVAEWKKRHAYQTRERMLRDK